MNYFITGTDTGVGKTFVTALWIRSLRRAGLDCVGMKPICCGDRADAELLRDASEGSEELDEINPVWLEAPAAPCVAAELAHREIDLDALRAGFARLRRAHRSLLVEGVGGWLVPIRRNYFVSDLAAELGLPVVVVVRNRLGSLNHALLTVRSIEACGQRCAGLILNNMDGPEQDPVGAASRALLEELAGVPVLFEVDQGQRELVMAVA